MATATASRIDWWGTGGHGGSATDLRRGSRMLANLLHMPIEEFERDYFLKRALFRPAPAGTALQSDSPARMLALADVKALLRRRTPRPARFLYDVDVTRYANGARSALLDGDGEVDPDAVWAAFELDGFSVRLVHPQQWHQACFELCSCLQEYFGFPVGCSAYLTPAATQGYPPHYDDVRR